MRNTSKVKETIQTFWKIYRDHSPEDCEGFMNACIAAMGDDPSQFMLDLCHAFRDQVQREWEESNR